MRMNPLQFLLIAFLSFCFSFIIVYPQYDRDVQNPDLFVRVTRGITLKLSENTDIEAQSCGFFVIEHLRNHALVSAQFAYDPGRPECENGHYFAEAKMAAGEWGILSSGEKVVYVREHYTVGESQRALSLVTDNKTFWFLVWMLFAIAFGLLSLLYSVIRGLSEWFFKPFRYQEEPEDNYDEDEGDEDPVSSDESELTIRLYKVTITEVPLQEEDEVSEEERMDGAEAEASPNSDESIEDPSSTKATSEGS